jgi:hypothetical protein
MFVRKAGAYPCSQVFNFRVGSWPYKQTLY